MGLYLKDLSLPAHFQYLKNGVENLRDPFKGRLALSHMDAGEVEALLRDGHGLVDLQVEGEVGVPAQKLHPAPPPRPSTCPARCRCRTRRSGRPPPWPCACRRSTGRGAAPPPPRRPSRSLPLEVKLASTKGGN